MYFVPLTQLESVELVIHALRAAGGEAECCQCPAYRVCTKQCLTIAAAIGKMLRDGTLPQLGGEIAVPTKNSPDKDPDQPEGGPSARKGRLKVVK
jgi:hypothetical protein